MKRHSKYSAAFYCFLFFAFFGCATASKLEKIAEADLPSEIPAADWKRLEVTDAPLAEAIPGAPSVPETPPEPVIETNAAVKKNTKKKKSVASMADVPKVKAFKYPSHPMVKPPFLVGEKQVFEISYFKMVAGDFELKVLPEKYVENRPVYILQGHAQTSSMFNLVYRVDDTLTSYWDKDGLFSYRFTMDIDETKQTRKVIDVYDPQRAQSFHWDRVQHVDRGSYEKKATNAIEPFSQDSLSALFYMRTLPLTDKAVYTFPVVTDGRAWTATATVEERVKVSSPFGTVPAIKIKLETHYRGLLEKTGESFLWFTDDENRYIIRLEAKVKVGFVVARLKEVEKGAGK